MPSSYMCSGVELGVATDRKYSERSSKSGSRRCKPRAMDFASSPISVEKKNVGPGMAEVPKKLDRCGIEHEIVALILMGIRVRVRKRRKQVKGAQGDKRGRGPRFFVSVASKEFSQAVSLLFATLAERSISVAANGLVGTKNVRTLERPQVVTPGRKSEGQKELH